MTNRAIFVASLLLPAWAVASPMSLDVTAGGTGQVIQDQAASPLLWGGGGGLVDLRLRALDVFQQEFLLRFEGAPVSAGLAQARGAGLAGEAAYRFLPRLTNGGPITVRVGPGVGLRGWTLGLESVLNEHRTWALGTELSLAAQLSFSLGAAGRVELDAGLPVLALAVRPPYATTDEPLRARSDDPLAFAFTGAVAGPDRWFRPAATVRWVHASARLTWLVALDLSWLSVTEPAPLRAGFVGLRAGLRWGATP